MGIQGISAGGFGGLNSLSPGIPFQPGPFHRQGIIRRYPARHPESAAAKALKALADGMFNPTQTGFQTALAAWYETHKGYLNGR
ncbi:hypothetical protein, partial [Neisseria iguanae]